MSNAVAGGLFIFVVMSAIGVNTSVRMFFPLTDDVRSNEAAIQGRDASPVKWSERLLLSCYLLRWIGRKGRKC